MAFTRRRMIQRSAAGAAGLLVAYRVTSGGAQSTPVGMAPDPQKDRFHLMSATELSDQRDDVQCLAIMPEQAFDDGRIANSRHLTWAELDLLDTSEESVAAWTASMQELAAVRGVRADMPVVVYDEGSLFAARGWWQLAYLGYDVPLVLDGGLSAWEEIGEPVESGPIEINPVEAPAIESPTLRRELLVTKDEVFAALDDPDVMLVDARSADEYAAGHIPGAVNKPYTSNAVADEVNTYFPASELRSSYKELGMNSDMRAIAYCSTGVRGAVAMFAMTLAGFENVALYVGSWDEWHIDPDMPVE